MLVVLLRVDRVTNCSRIKEIIHCDPLKLFSRHYINYFDIDTHTHTYIYIYAYAYIYIYVYIYIFTCIYIYIY